MTNNSADSQHVNKPEQLRSSAIEKIGFRFGNKGTHSSRTIMLNDLSVLFRVAGGKTSRAEYRELIVDDNCLSKRTTATRKLSDQRLSELYALDPGVLLFRIMRRLWDVDEQGRPLLAVLMAMSRDPLLRITALPIIRLHPGEELGRQTLTDALNQETGHRFNEATLDKIVRNTASSWTQSGHLQGRSRKVRQSVTPTPAATVFALLLGHLSGTRGSALFESQWNKVLDAPAGDLMHIAMDARRLGLLDMSMSGGVVDVSFSRLLAKDERI